MESSSGKLNDFEFSDYADDTDKEFEDSKETQSDDEIEEDFFTPKNFKSSYAIKWSKLASKSSSTSDLTLIRKTVKRQAGSPVDFEKNKKRCSSSSLKI